MSDFTIRIVFDNKCSEPGFLMGFGFSALIYNNYSRNYSLFDTGGNGNTLIQNLKEFQIDVKAIKNVIISHNHQDHAGGLEKIYELNSNINIFIPQTNLSSYARAFPKASVHGIKEFMEIEEGMFSSGEYGTSFTEQCLFLQLKTREIIILVGCAHPGLERFIVRGRKMGPVRAAIGGFHGFSKFSYLEDIKFIGACHCTAQIQAIASKFPDQFKKVCVGSTYSF